MSTIIPPEIIHQLNQRYNLEEEFYFADEINNDKGNSIRMNPGKWIDPDQHKERIEWCDEGYYIKKKIRAQSDPLYHAGCYCIQDAPSMFIAYIIKALQLNDHPIKMLNLCGGSEVPGTLLLDNTHPDSLLLINSLQKARIKTLISGLNKWGNANVFVSANPLASFSHLPGYFDLIMVNPPHSGQLKNTGNVSRQGEEVIHLFNKHQKHILSNCIDSLKTNGIIIYATHSPSEEENEQIADWLCKEQNMEPISIPVDPRWNIVEKASNHYSGFRFDLSAPDKKPFFVTVLRKKKKQESSTPPTIPFHQPALPEGFLKNWIKTDREMCTIIKEKSIYLFPACLEQDFSFLQGLLNFEKIGISIGELIDNHLVPNEELAFSTFLSPKVIKKELSKKEALSLHTEKRFRHPNKPPFTLATYKGFGLAWI